MRSENMVGALDQQGPEVDIASLGDAELRVVVSGFAASRPQAEVTADIPTSLERSLLLSVRTYVSAVSWPTP
jgi:hypothetical protein